MCVTVCMWEYVMVWLWVCVYGVEGREMGEGREREKVGGEEKGVPYQH